MSCSAIPPTDAPDPLHIEGEWLTETVLALARGVAVDLAFDRLPILADALEEAGCDNFTLLNHLRSNEYHRVECWALRRLLRTTLMLPSNMPITFAYCPPGSFLMGSSHARAYETEKPARFVAIGRPLHVGIYPVTQEQWQAVMGNNPSRFPGSRRPIERVTWHDATAFCEQAAKLTGRPLRLPTEAEWEYFGRSGTIGEYHYGDEPVIERMNCIHSMVEPQTTLVGSYPPTPWGLFDTHGNVLEWCQDWYDAEFYATGSAADPVCEHPGAEPDNPRRCCRGGSWRYNAAGCRSALRNSRTPNTAEEHIGFRVVFTTT